MTGLLVLLNVLVFCGEVLTDGAIVPVLALWPMVPGTGMEDGMHFLPWQLVTYAFLHANLAHLIFNMLGLLIFGREIEARLGPGGMLAIYGASLVTAGMTQLVVTGFIAPAHVPTIGASGGVFGLLFAYARLYPHRIVVLLFPPVPMPAWVFAMLYAILELSLGLTESRSGIAHFAHLGGMAGSAILLRHWHVRAEPHK